MDADRITELRALSDEATPGPWRVRWFPVDTVTGEGGDYVVEAGDINGHAEELICYGDWDGDFIAAARTAVPELLAEVERLSDMVAEFRKREATQDTMRKRLTAERDEARAALERVRGVVKQPAVILNVSELGLAYERVRRAIEGGGRWDKEHVVVAEAAIDRKLAPDEHVHHINGVKVDNRPENLHVCTRTEHSLAHASFSALLPPLMDMGVVVFDATTGRYSLA